MNRNICHTPCDKESSHSFTRGNKLDKNNPVNYRPITLTNTDYTIFTKSLAIRLQRVIKSVINEDQVGLVKGRHIAPHLKLIYDLTTS